MPVFWQQIIDLLVGHAGEAVKHVFEIRKGFVAVASGAFDQGVEDGTAFAGVFSSDEEPILFAHSCGTNGVFDEVVVYFDLSVVEEGLELRPKAKGVVDGLA